MNKESYIEERTLALEKALVFHINNQIKKHFNTTEEYVKYFNNCNNHQFNKMLNNAFSIPSSIIKSICGDRVKDENGKRCRVVYQIKTNLINRGNIILLKHFHEHYTDSKKDYTTVDRYLINPDKINAVLFDDVKISDINSGYYTDLERRLIYRYILNPDQYIKNFKNMKKRVKKNKSTQIKTTEEQTKDELEMETIETEINETKTNTEPTMTTKPDTYILDMLNMMNEKINSLIKDNIELKKELDEIKSSIQNTNISKVEDKEEKTVSVDTNNTEVEDDIIDEINEDNSNKTLPKMMVLDNVTQNTVKESKNNTKVFNGKDRDTFITNLREAYAKSKISYVDYLNFLIVLGIPKDRMPKIPDEFKNKIRVSKYFNAFYDCLKSRGYNLFGITRMPEQ